MARFYIVDPDHLDRGLLVADVPDAHVSKRHVRVGENNYPRRQCFEVESAALAYGAERARRDASWFDQKRQDAEALGTRFRTGAVPLRRYP